MANKSSGRRSPKNPIHPPISGMDGEPMHNEILLRLPHNECRLLFALCSAHDGQASRSPLAFCKEQDSSNIREER